MKYLKYIILFLLGVSIQLIFAQNKGLTGIIIDKYTKKPIANVVVKIDNYNISTTANNDGYFEISNIQNSILSVSHVGYINRKIQIRENNRHEPLKIELEPTILNLSEIEIVGLSENQMPFSIEKINLKKIESTNLSDIGGIIAKEPNIGGIKKGATGIDPVIRGFKYSQVIVQLNGGTKIEGGCPNRMDPTASHVNVNDLQNVTIYKGPFALKYGPNFGGLINLQTTKSLFYNKFENHISMIVGTQTNHIGYKSGIRLNGGNSRFAYIFSANKNKFGNYTSGNGDIIKSSSDNYNISAGFGFRPFDGHVTTINFDRSWGRNVDFPALPMDERTDDTKIFEVSYLGAKFNNSINFIKFHAYHSNVNHEMDNKSRPFSDTVVAISRIHAMNTGGRFATNFNALQGNLEVGANFENIYKDGNREKWLIMQPGLPNFTESIWKNARINNIGVFAEYQNTHDKVNWIVSVRTDFNSANSDPMLRLKPNGSSVYENNDTKSEFINFSFSAGLTWNINRSSEISVSFGKSTRSPDMIERYIILLPVGYDPYDYLGNPKLLPETNHEIDFAYKFDNHKLGIFTASVFFSYVTNYISGVRVPPSQVMPQTKGVLGVKTFNNIDDAYLTGFEVTYGTPINYLWEVRLTSAYTTGINPLSTAYIIENGSVVGETTVKNDPLPEIPPLEANIWLNYEFLNNRLVPEINIRMVAAQNKVSKAFNEDNTPGFALLNFKLNYKYNDQLQINAGINNIFNINYYEHLSRRIIGTKSPYLEPGRLFYANLIIKL